MMEIGSNICLIFLKKTSYLFLLQNFLFIAKIPIFMTHSVIRYYEIHFDFQSNKKLYSNQYLFKF